VVRFRVAVQQTTLGLGEDIAVGSHLVERPGDQATERSTVLMLLS
jgi:hypothetical protein